MKPLIIYHANCNDGFGAAYAAWTKFKDEAEYIPAQYGDLCIDPMAGEFGLTRLVGKDGAHYDVDRRNIYILDFSFSPEITDKLAKASGHLIWLDHHKTAFDDHLGKEYLTKHRQQYFLQDKKRYYLLDNCRSGAFIAWDYFNPELGVPELIQHIDDRDRWQFKIPGTRELHAGLQQYEHDFELWHEIALGGSKFHEIMNEGKVLVKALDGRVESAINRELKEVRLRAIDHTDVDGFKDYNGLAANVVSDISEIGNAIAKRSGTFALTFFIKGGEAVCSLRSIGDFDVSAIAKFYGGGGHKNASGFKMPIQRFFGEIWK